MKKSLIAFGLRCLGVAVIGLVFLGGLAALSYNNLLKRQQAVNKEWAQLHKDYKRRVEFIPKMLNVFTNVADIEPAIVAEIVQTRAALDRVSSPSKKAPKSAEELEDFQRAQENLTAALSRLKAALKQHPNLAGTQEVLRHSLQWHGMQHRIAIDRIRFNEAVNQYNLSIQRFPPKLVAWVCGFRELPQFTALGELNARTASVDAGVSGQDPAPEEP